MHITNNDLQFLIYLENKIGSAENWSKDTLQLWRLIEKLQKQRETENEKTRQAIAKKRKHNKNYARSKREA